jgi:hypothetical protein
VGWGGGELWPFTGRAFDDMPLTCSYHALVRGRHEHGTNMVRWGKSMAITWQEQCTNCKNNAIPQQQEHAFAMMIWSSCSGCISLARACHANGKSMGGNMAITNDFRGPPARTPKNKGITECVLSMPPRGLPRSLPKTSPFRVEPPGTLQRNPLSNILDGAWKEHGKSMARPWQEHGKSRARASQAVCP